MANATNICEAPCKTLAFTGNRIVDVFCCLIVSNGGQFTTWLYAGSQQLAKWQISLSPGQAFRSQWARDRDGALGLRVGDSAGNILAQTGELP